MVDRTTSMTPTSTAKLFDQIVPSDTEEYDATLKALYCQVGGDAVLEDWQGRVVTFTLVAGQVLPVRPRKVRIGTDATLVGLWT